MPTNTRACKLKESHEESFHRLSSADSAVCSASIQTVSPPSDTFYLPLKQSSMASASSLTVSHSSQLPIPVPSSSMAPHVLSVPMSHQSRLSQSSYKGFESFVPYVASRPARDFKVVEDRSVDGWRKGDATTAGTATLQSCKSVSTVTEACRLADGSSHKNLLADGSAMAAAASACCACGKASRGVYDVCESCNSRSEKACIGVSPAKDSEKESVEGGRKFSPKRQRQDTDKESSEDYHFRYKRRTDLAGQSSASAVSQGEGPDANRGTNEKRVNDGAAFCGRREKSAVHSREGEGSQTSGQTARAYVEPASMYELWRLRDEKTSKAVASSKPLRTADSVAQGSRRETQTTVAGVSVCVESGDPRSNGAEGEGEGYETPAHLIGDHEFAAFEEGLNRDSRESSPPSSYPASSQGAAEYVLSSGRLRSTAGEQGSNLWHGGACTWINRWSTRLSL